MENHALRYHLQLTRLDTLFSMYIRSEVKARTGVSVWNDDVGEINDVVGER